jgi:lactate permease
VTGPPLEPALWAAGFAPVAVLFVLVLWGRVGTRVPALVALALTAVLAATVFRSGWEVLGVAIGKGLWLGLWILLVVWPSLLLFRIASVAGLERLGQVFTSILPRRRENLLLVAWVFPALIQGVAGFGTPIAVAAPLLLAMGWGPVRAVAYPLVGYHWSVTFGSMGSSFYMASLTARLDGSQQVALAGSASALLAVSCLVSGALVLLMDGGLRGLREGARTLLVVGLPMAATLVGVALLVPAIATLSAAAVGLGVVVLLNLATRRSRVRHEPAGGRGERQAGTTTEAGSGVGGDGRADGGGDVLVDEPRAAQISGPTGVLLLAPYLYLLVAALPVFLVPASRAWVRSHLSMAPDFGATATGFGWRNVPEADYTPVALLGHPGFYVLLACLLGYVTFRLAGLWQGPASRGVVRGWLRGLPAASLPIVLLATLASVLVDSGMVSLLARGTAEVAGGLYPALAPVVGAVGSFMTGSTTSSNALFAPLQAQIAGVLGLDPEILVAAQTAGGNAGNSLAPVVLLIGATTVGAVDAASAILRTCLLPVGVLLAVVSALTMTAAAGLLP